MDQQQFFNQFSIKSCIKLCVNFIRALCHQKQQNILYRSISSQRYVHDYRWVKSGGQIHGRPLLTEIWRDALPRPLPWIRHCSIPLLSLTIALPLTRIIFANCCKSNFGGYINTVSYDRYVFICVRLSIFAVYFFFHSMAVHASTFPPFLTPYCHPTLFNEIDRGNNEPWK
jgi:hypothetical protein